MSIMSLLSIEKTRKECFFLVGGANCFGVIVRSSLHITGCRLDRWKDLMETGAGYWKLLRTSVHQEMQILLSF